MCRWEPSSPGHRLLPGSRFDARPERQAGKDITIGFDVPEYNEAEHAKAVAAHLGTEHTELYVTSAQALAVIPKLPEIYDEVFADSSQIPTFLISQLTRRFVTVSLSGDGGDELFYGYPSYQNAIIRWNRTKMVPHSLRARFAGLRKRSPQEWDDFLERYTSRLPQAFRARISGLRIVNLLDSLALHGPDELFFFFLSRCKEPEALVLRSRNPGLFIRTHPSGRVSRTLWSA